MLWIFPAKAIARSLKLVQNLALSAVPLCLITVQTSANVVTLTVLDPRIPDESQGVTVSGYGRVETGIGFDKDGKQFTSKKTVPTQVAQAVIMAGDKAKEKRDKTL